MAGGGEEGESVCDPLGLLVVLSSSYPTQAAQGCACRCLEVSCGRRRPRKSFPQTSWRLTVGITVPPGTRGVSGVTSRLESHARGLRAIAVGAEQQQHPLMDALQSLTYNTWQLETPEPIAPGKLEDTPFTLVDTAEVIRAGSPPHRGEWSSWAVEDVGRDGVRGEEGEEASSEDLRKSSSMEEGRGTLREDQPRGGGRKEAPKGGGLASVMVCFLSTFRLCHLCCCLRCTPVHSPSLCCPGAGEARRKPGRRQGGGG